MAAGEAKRDQNIAWTRSFPNNSTSLPQYAERYTSVRNSKGNRSSVRNSKGNRGRKDKGRKSNRRRQKNENAQEKGTWFGFEGIV